MLLQKYMMIWLAIMPILGIYRSPFIFSWSEVFFFIIAILALQRCGIKNVLTWPKKWKIYWCFVSVSYFVACMQYSSPFKAIIPGGVAFCLFSLKLGIVTNTFKIELLYKYMRSISIFAVVILFLQEVSVITSGIRFSALLPFGTLTDGLPVSDLRVTQMYADRSCSIFREPAHFAQYLLPLLAIELFWKSKDKMISPFSILLLVAILFLRSGNGIIGVLLLLLLKFISNLKKMSRALRILFSVFAIVSSLFCFVYISKTIIGQELIERTAEFENNEQSKSYIRIYRGFALYSSIPIEYKLFGTNNEGILNQIKKSQVSYLFAGERDESDLYFNGAAGVLLHNGFIGLIFLVLYFIDIGKKTDLLGKSLLLVFILISFVAQTYMSSLMLMCCIIANQQNLRSKES